MSSVGESAVSRRWPVSRALHTFSRAELRHYHWLFALLLVAYAAGFMIWAALKPFGVEDIRFLAVEDTGSAAAPLLAGIVGLLAAQSSLTSRPRLGWLLLSI